MAVPPFSAPAHVPPPSLHQVIKGVYRSSYPQEENYSYLKTLNLKTVITLTNDQCPKFKRWLAANGISHHVITMASTKEGICIETMAKALKVLLDTANYPILVHCNHGKHRTGCVIGTMRKIAFWNVTDVVQEYSTIASPKIRQCDVGYLTKLDIRLFLDY